MKTHLTASGRSICPNCLDLKAKPYTLDLSLPVLLEAPIPPTENLSCTVCTERATRYIIIASHRPVSLLCELHYKMLLTQEVERFKAGAAAMMGQVTKAASMFDFVALEICLLSMMSLRDAGKNAQFRDAYTAVPLPDAPAPNLQNIGTQTGRMQSVVPNESGTAKPARPVHCPRCAQERGVAIPKECPHVSPNKGGCWYCWIADNKLVFCNEFDTYIHIDCIKAQLAALPPGTEDPELAVIAAEFKEALAEGG